MSQNIQKTMKVTCFLKDKELCELEWDELPNTGMSFYHNKKEYLITEIKDSKIIIKDITKQKVKNK